MTLNEELDNPQWLLRGNVFGAGSGLSKYKFDFNYDGDCADTDITYRGNPVNEEDYSSSAGSVTRFTQVDVYGGTIHRNVYGGGSLASVGAPKIGQDYNPYRRGDTASGHTAGKQSTNIVNIGGVSGQTVTIGTPEDYYGGTDGYKDFYGGEVYGASRGEGELKSEQFATTVWTIVNILNGSNILGNVFGGGDAGMVKMDSEVNVGEKATTTP